MKDKLMKHILWQNISWDEIQVVIKIVCANWSAYIPTKCNQTQDNIKHQFWWNTNIDEKQYVTGKKVRWIKKYDKTHCEMKH